jgi:uncharacterized cupin superfamily protein
VRVAVSSGEDVIELRVATPLGEFKAAALAGLHVARTRPGGVVMEVHVEEAELDYVLDGDRDIVDHWVTPASAVI